MSSILKDRELPLLITVLMALLMISEFVIDYQPLVNTATTFRSWSLIIAGCVTIVAYLTMLKHHFVKISEGGSSIYLNVIAAGSSILYVLVGLTLGTNSDLYSALYSAIPGTVSTTMWSMMGVFLMVGVYRAFRASTVEGTLFLIASAILMLANAPVGSVIWPGFPVVADWLQKNIQRTALRGLVLTGAMGALIAALRTLLGEETGYLKKILGK